MKRTRSEPASDAEALLPALKKAKKDNVNVNDEDLSFSELPPELWREVALFCRNPDPMSPSAGDFATFPLLTTCKSVSNVIAELPLWKFIRELKGMSISDEEWSVKNGFADFHWNTRLVYGKTFLRMLNTISTRLKQRRMDAKLKELRKSIPAFKEVPDHFIVFESFLDCQPSGITTNYDEGIAGASLTTTRCTLNFSEKESVTLSFTGADVDDYCCQKKIAVVDTSPALKKLESLDRESLFESLAEKLKISADEDFPHFFYGLFLENFDLGDPVEDDEYEGWAYTYLHPLFQDIQLESYKLAANEVPHPAEAFLIPVVDSLQETNLFPNMAAMNLINAILRSSYKIGAKLFAQMFIEHNKLGDKLPQSFIDHISWMFLEWRNESVSVFNICNESNSVTIRIESSEYSFFIGVESEGLANIASANKKNLRDPLVLTYGTGIDQVQAKCGCEKLSRDVFVSLLLAIGNIDTTDTVFVDQDLQIPLDFVSPSLAKESTNDGTSASEDESSEEDSDEEDRSELDELQEELKGLQEEAVQTPSSAH